MRIITFDAETYYDKEYSLSKITTEEYVRDDRFELIGFSYKIDDMPARWVTGPQEYMQAQLLALPWQDSFALAHNAMFDASILSWRFGIKPIAWLDTLSMARAVRGAEAGNSLAKLAEVYGIGKKGEEVINALGKRRKDFDDSSLKRYGEYCNNDTELCFELFNILVKHFKQPELKLIDLTLRMFYDPVLELDTPMLEAHLEEVKARKERLMQAVQTDRESLMSNPKFAELLRQCGVEPPTKISPTTGKETLALAKSDEEFKALAEHPDERVQALVAARLGNKSTLEETRTERFIAISKRGSMPVPLQYYAAHTGRWGGTDKINLQNLPSRGANAGKLKKAIRAPKGYEIIDSDSSQIEARVLAWFAGQTDLVESFRRKDDVYKVMAAAIYSKAAEEIAPQERFVGKTTVLGCVAEGTLVLCDSGWKPIERVASTDRLWDGKEWVCHQGLQNSGIKETLNLCGVWLTPDHRVWSGTQWLESQSLVQDGNILSQALGSGAENLPSQAIYGAQGEASVLLSSGVSADLTSTVLTHIISKTLKAPDAPYVPKLLPLKNGIGCIRTQWPTTNTEQGFSIDWHLQLQDATPHQTEPTHTMAPGAYRYVKSGELIEPVFSGMFKRLMGGAIQVLRWIGLMSTETTNRGISDLCPEATTSKTNDESPTLRRKLQTYDLAYAGPRNRYTILTEQGPLLIHNCGYGMGALKFQAQLKAFGTQVSEGEARHIVDTYRVTYPKVPQLWQQAGTVLEAIMANQSVPFGNGCIEVHGKDGLLMPNGLYQRYPNLRKIIDSDGKEQFVYDSKRGPNKIYGGKLVENVCQSLARIIIGEQLIKIAKKYRVVLTVHDAIACIAPKDEVEEAIAYVEEIMQWAPDWAQGLPLGCEAGHGESYGDC